MSSFHFTVPGQPVSWNAAYRVKRQFDGTKMVRGLFKTPEAEAYQDGVRTIARTAKPSYFAPPPRCRIIVAYDFVLKRDIDCDNLMKLMNDALADALQVNDKSFMPVVMSKTISSKNPYTLVTVYDATQWQVQIYPR